MPDWKAIPYDAPIIFESLQATQKEIDRLIKNLKETDARREVDACQTVGVLIKTLNKQNTVLKTWLLLKENQKEFEEATPSVQRLNRVWEK